MTSKLPINIVFGENIKRLRKEAGYKTQESFCKALEDACIKASDKTVKNWEQGKTIPETGTLLQICDFFGVDLDYLFGRMDEKTHTIKFIKHETGLSEKAIEKMQKWNSCNDRRRKWSEYISSIIEHNDFDDLLSYLSTFFGYVTAEVYSIEKGDNIGASESIDIQTAHVWKMSTVLNNIVESLALNKRLEIHARHSKKHK